MRRVLLAAALAIAAAGVAPAAASADFAITGPSTASESDGTATYTVTRSGLGLEAATISVSATGAPGSPSPSSLQFASGETGSKNVTLPIDDSVDQSDPTHPVTVTIAFSGSAPLADSITTPSVTTQVADNDTTIDVAPAAVTVGEGGTATVTLTPRAAVDHAMTVTYSTQDGSATAGADYAAQSGTVTFPANSSAAQTISVPTVQDPIDEDDETLGLNLGVAGGAISATNVPITIADDDPPPLVGAVGTRVPEGSSGVHALPILVQLSAPSSKTVSVTYTTRDGTATAPSDYGGATGRLTFAPGETAKTVNVLINGDKTPEPDEAFVLALSNPDNATLAGGGDQAATITLADDDGYSPVTAITTAAQSPKDTTDPRIALGRLTRHGSSRLTLTVACPRTERSCTGTVSLFTVATKGHPERSLAKTRFTLKSGARRTITLKLSKSAQAYVKRLRRVKVRAYAVAQDAAGNVGTATASATLPR